MMIFNSLKEKIQGISAGKVLHYVSLLLVMIVVSAIVSKVVISGEKIIKDNPKAIIDSVEKYYKDEQQKARQTSIEKAPKIATNLEKANPTIIGNRNGSKVVVEFFDYACGHCKRQAVEMKKVIKSNSDVKVVLADLAIMSQHSLAAAQTGVYVALKNPDKLERYYDELSQKQVNPESIKQVLKMIGLPENYVKLASKDSKVEEVLQRNFQAAREVGLQGTPALIINGKFVGGMTTADDVIAMLK